MTFDRLFDTISEILDFADDRSSAWSVACGAALATAATWWYVLSRSTEARAISAAPLQPLTPVDQLLAAAAVFAPFVLVNAVWQAVAPMDLAEKTAEDNGPLSNVTAGAGTDHRRRRLMAAALVGLLNGFVMYLVTH